MTDSKIKAAAGKVDLTLLPLDIVGDCNDALLNFTGCARAFGYGAKKYARGNYLMAEDSPETFYRYVGAALRHHAAGDEKLDESGLPHWCHEQASLLMLLTIFLRARSGLRESFEETMQEEDQPISIACYHYALQHFEDGNVSIAINYLGMALKRSIELHQHEDPGVGNEPAVKFNQSASVMVES